MKKSTFLGLLASLPMMALSTSAYANYNVTVANTGGQPVYALYGVNNGYNNSYGFVSGNFALLVPGHGTINFTDIGSGYPCSSWAVAITYKSQILTYYYEGGGRLTVNLDASGNLSLTAPWGTVVPKPAGQCF